MTQQQREYFLARLKDRVYQLWLPLSIIYLIICFLELLNIAKIREQERSYLLTSLWSADLKNNKSQPLSDWEATIILLIWIQDCLWGTRLTYWSVLAIGRIARLSTNDCQSRLIGQSLALSGAPQEGPQIRLVSPHSLVSLICNHPWYYDYMI